MKDFIDKAVYATVIACEGNPIMTVFISFLFYVGANGLEALIEKVFWGETFLHWFDLVLAAGFLLFAAKTVWVCAVVQAKKDKS